MYVVFNCFAGNPPIKLGNDQGIKFFHKCIGVAGLIGKLIGVSTTAHQIALLIIAIELYDQKKQLTGKVSFVVVGGNAKILLHCCVKILNKADAIGL